MEEYGKYKGYQDSSPTTVEGTLQPDRRRVFHAIIRALYNEILPQKVRVIDFLESVTGIWGLRYGDDEGKHQFRLSVVWKPDLDQLLREEKLSNFPRSLGGHVLLPGEDNDPMFDGFEVKGGTTYRQTGREPKLQLSYLREDPTVGEIDIDFHGGWGCHLTPSNSDPGSAENDSHSHADDLNLRYNFFQYPLELNYWDYRNHCKNDYSDAYYDH
ncbi:hypothetical protein MYX82_06365 [Acidobacteria bacterium AH-259-D05]|nr:hypothetical protein [Acidobacteria bacterium AH-259-D05]